MAKKPKTYGPYTRVAPLRSHLGGYSSLWVAQDHVLAVTSSGYTDNYKRFYFRDIQGILVEDSDRSFYIKISFSLLLAALLIICVLSGATWSSYLFWTLILGTPIVMDIVKGPTCKVFLVTQVQSVRLKAISRRARLEKFLQAVQPLIEAAQADLPRPPRPGAKAVPEGMAGGAPVVTEGGTGT